jgi:molybdopterin converting factor small subunit
MTVEVNLPPLLQTLAGGVKRIDVGGGTVGECLQAIAEKYPAVKARLFTEDGKLAKGLNVYINGENTRSDMLARQVKDGDKIHLAYLIFGG